MLCCVLRDPSCIAYVSARHGVVLCAARHRAFLMLSWTSSPRSRRRDQGGLTFVRGNWTRSYVPSVKCFIVITGKT